MQIDITKGKIEIREEKNKLRVKNNQYKNSIRIVWSWFQELIKNLVLHYST